MMTKQILLEGRVLMTLLEAEQTEPVVELRATCDGFTSTMTGATRMAYTLPADKMVQLKISYKDKNGNPASIDGAVTWESSDVGIVRLEPLAVNPQADNSAVMMIPGTQIGNCQVSAKADADLGTGVRELVTLLDVTVVGGEAVTGTIEPVGEAIPVPEGAAVAPGGAAPAQRPRRGF